MGILLTDDAKAWYQYRREILGDTDTWTAYQDTIQQEYCDTWERATAHMELSCLRYEGNIKVYLNEFCTLNLITGINGESLQEKIDLAMPDDILDMRAINIKESWKTWTISWLPKEPANKWNIAGSWVRYDENIRDISTLTELNRDARTQVRVVRLTPRPTQSSHRWVARCSPQSVFTGT